MKRLLQSVAAFALLAAIFLPYCSSSARAATIDTLYSNDFSDGNFPPIGWTDNSYDPGLGQSGWYYSNDGYDGSNGALVCDVWNYSTGKMLTPVIDLSNYSGIADTAWVDFDLFFELDEYPATLGPDHFKMSVVNDQGNELVLNVNSTTDPTYFYAAQDYHATPLTDPTDWRHYHVGIPKDYRVSSFQVAWEGDPSGQGLSNPAIDNVVISAAHYVRAFVTPTSNINFGQVVTGDSAIRCIYLSNPTIGDVNVSNITLTGSPYFQILHQPTILAAGTYRNPTLDSICIRYLPQSGGPAGGSVTFGTDGDAPANYTITVQGFGLAPILSINGAKNLFIRRNTRLGDTIYQSFLISNTGFGDLLVRTDSIGGDYPGEYSIVRVPGEGIAGGQSDTITLAYHPTMEGSRPATFYLTTNGGPEVQISLRGVGTLPRLTVLDAAGNQVTDFSFDSVATGSTVCKTLQLQNNGTDTVAILSNNFSSADYDFSYTGVTGSDTLIAPNQTRTVNVCFTPLRNGTREATLRIRTNIPLTYTTPQRDTSAFDVQISGIGVPYGRLAIGGLNVDSVIVNQTLCQTDTIRNTGQSTLTILSDTITGANASEFTLSGVVFPVVLQPGATKIVNFCVAPAARGARLASLVLTVNTNDSTEHATIPLAAFGLQVCASPSAQALFGTQKTLIGKTDTASVTITNCGDVATTYAGALSSNATMYAIRGASTSPVVQPGGTATFLLAFTPTDRTPTNETLTVTGGTGVTPMVINLTGTGGSATITAAGNAGDVAVSDCKNFDVTLTNNGNVDWTPGTPAITGANASDFTIVSGPTPATITAGNSAVVTVKFCPSVTTSETASLGFPQSAPTESPVFTYALTGNGVTSGVADVTTSNDFMLEQSYPNPFTNTTSISYSIPESAPVRIDIVDETGAIVKTLVNARVEAGPHSVTVSARDLGTASGTYFYVLSSGATRIMRQMTLVK